MWSFGHTVNFPASSLVVSCLHRKRGLENHPHDGKILQNLLKWKHFHTRAGRVRTRSGQSDRSPDDGAAIGNRSGLSPSEWIRQKREGFPLSQQSESIHGGNQRTKTTTSSLCVCVCVSRKSGPGDTFRSRKQTPVPTPQSSRQLQISGQLLLWDPFRFWGKNVQKKYSLAEDDKMKKKTANVSVQPLQLRTPLPLLCCGRILTLNFEMMGCHLKMDKLPWLLLYFWWPF